MRNIVILMILFVIVGAVLYSKNDNNVTQIVEISPGATPDLGGNRVNLNNAVYLYELFIVSNPESINLIPNFETQASASALVVENNCTYAINGGFYGANNLPVGLFRVNGKVYGRQSSSTLVNGFVSINNNSVSISTQPNINATIVLQSGPLLMTNGKPLNLQLIDDKVSRRSWLGITDSGDIVFSVVHSPQVEILGPRLEDLPQLVELIAKEENINLIQAINLDGGKASYFHTKEKTLSEVSPIGSLFCIR
jgi:uncharacterized protein YigE (DUF2233 family)